MLILNTVGPPTNGPYPTGEVALDSSGNGWYCQTAGTPGTWIGGGASTSITVVSNAVTVPIWATNVKLVNSSDANIAVTLSTTGAIDGQKKLIPHFL